MERKRKKINIKFIVLILSLIIFLSMSIFTFAWFTDSKSFTGNLTFGSLELDVSGGVSGDGIDSATSKLVFDVARQKAGDSTWTGKIMPGDMVNINLAVGLKDGSEPAYYMVFISDKKGYFENAAYYGIKDSSNNLSVYKSNGQKVVLQSTGETKTGIYTGKILAGTANAHNLTISAKIKEEMTEQKATTEIECRVCAIQQANLTEENARIELNLNGSANILPINYNVANTTINGVTITNNGDKTFTLNGTATNSYMLGAYLGTKSLNINLSGKYITTFGISGTAGDMVYCEVVCNGLYQGTNRSSTIVIELNGTLEMFYMIFYQGETMTNFVIKPQLIKLY